MNYSTSQPAWLMNQALVIDRHVPFVGGMLRAGAERRQVIAAYLSTHSPSEDRMAEVGRFLLSADHRSILSAAFGRVDVGLRGALRRAGSQVHERSFYTLLHQLLAHPPHDQIVSAISRMGALDLKRLKILAALPASIARANVVEVLDEERDAYDVASAFNLLVSLGIDSHALAVAICRVRSPEDFTRVWQRWPLKVPCSNEHPVAAVPGLYRPMGSIGEAKEWGRKFRNCLGTRYISGILQGIDSFGLYEDKGRQAVVHLRREGGVWAYEGAYLQRNMRPPQSMLIKLCEHLERQGVRVPQVQRSEPTPWDSLRRLMQGTIAFDFDL